MTSRYLGSSYSIRCLYVEHLLKLIIYISEIFYILTPFELQEARLCEESGWLRVSMPFRAKNYALVRGYTSRRHNFLKSDKTVVPIKVTNLVQNNISP